MLVLYTAVSETRRYFSHIHFRIKYNFGAGQFSLHQKTRKITHFNVKKLLYLILVVNSYYKYTFGRNLHLDIGVLTAITQQHKPTKFCIKFRLK